MVMFCKTNKEQMILLTERLMRVESLMEGLVSFIKCDDHEFSLNGMHDKLDYLISDADREERVQLALKTLDKFDDYMKNVDKLNSMVNEFKGCVSVSRASLGDRKAMDDAASEMKNFSTETEHILKTVVDFVSLMDRNQAKLGLKVDVMYNAICMLSEKKSLKKRKPRKKKKTVNQDS